MLTSILLSCALTVAQPADRADWLLTPQLSPGLELAYSGYFLDESLIPNALHQRQYRLEARMLVMEAGVKDWHVAFMTGLSLQDGKKPIEKKTSTPASMRLDQAKIDWQGRVYTLNKKLMALPLDGPATLEFGFVAPVPLTKVGRATTWEINDPGMPAQRWQVAGIEISGGVACLKLIGVQQSDDWERGRADKSAWRRRDVIWLHPQLNVAQRVERVIEQRAAAREAPTHRSTVRYDLDTHVRYPNRFLEECKNEIAKASTYQQDAQTLMRQPVLNRTQLDGLIQRVSFHLENPQSPQTTPYRKAVVHVKTVLEKAKQGDVPAPPIAVAPAPVQATTLDVGRRVPNFAVSSLTEPKTLQLKELAGKPFLVVFYNPATMLGKEVMQYAKELNEKYAEHVGIVAMAVTSDPEVACKQHKDLRLAFPILDGNGLRQTFGAVDTPRFVVVDGNGVVRMTATGWGVHVPHDIADALLRCKRQ